LGLSQIIVFYDILDILIISIVQVLIIKDSIIFTAILQSPNHLAI